MECLNYGGDMLTIDVESELSKIETLLNKKENYWMGLNSKLPL